MALIYLPPYIPDYNPIEKMWSKIKSFLRKVKVRVFDEPVDHIEVGERTVVDGARNQNIKIYYRFVGHI